MKLIQLIEKEIALGKLKISPLNEMDRDVGIQAKVINLLLSYKRDYLRIGLETIFGELIEKTEDKSMKDILKTFIKQVLNVYFRNY